MRHLSIAHVDDSMTWRGGERQALELIKGLRRYDTRNVLICRPGSEISRRALDNGIEVVHLPLLGGWDFLSVLKMRSCLNREKIDIVHTHTSHAHTLAFFALRGMPACRLVVSRRVDFHLHSIFSRLYKYGKSVDRIIAVSDAIRRVLVEDGIDPDRVVTVRSGFIPEQFAGGDTGRDLRKETGIPQDAVVVATVAALAPHKAHCVLLKAAHLLAKRNPRIRFLLAGEGELRSKIERDIHNLGLEDTVKLLGFVGDVGAVYRAADIFAISSREEGLCSSILDAMYFSLPVVATKAGGIPELVSDGVNGFIVPVDNCAMFADRLDLLAGDAGLRAKMGRRAAPVLERNSIEETVAGTFEVYVEVTCSDKA